MRFEATFAVVASLAFAVAQEGWRGHPNSVETLGGDEQCKENTSHALAAIAARAATFERRGRKSTLTQLSNRDAKAKQRGAKHAASILAACKKWR